MATETRYYVEPFDHPVSLPSDEVKKLPPYSDVDLNSNNPWGLPDWEKKEKYEKLSTASHMDLRWEFIRRSNKYRDLWMQMQKRRTETGDTFVIFDEEFTAPVERDFGFPLIGPQFDCFSDEHRPWAMNLRSSAADILVFPLCDDTMCWFDDWFEKARADNCALIRIDPTKPLTPQFNSARKIVQEGISDDDDRLGLYGLEEIPQPPKKRKHVKKYPLYLRLLDARNNCKSSPPSYGKIANTLILDGTLNDGLVEPIDRVKELYQQARGAQSFFFGVE